MSIPNLEFNNLADLMISEGHSMVIKSAFNSIYHEKHKIDLLDGDIVECGVWRGGMSLFLTKLFPNKKIWLADSYDGFQDIEKNYSQAFQDLFTLTMLNGKKNGTYIEIGGSDPINMNNTYLLEKSFGWKGLSFELDSEIAKYYNSVRVNKCFCFNPMQPCVGW